MRPPSIDRRQFLRLGISAGVGALSYGLGGLLSGCSAGCPCSVPAPRHSHRVLADVHAHPNMNTWIEGTPYGQIPLLSSTAKDMFNQTDISWKTCHDAGIDLLCVSHFNVFDEWVSMPTDPNPEAPDHTIQMMNALEEELAGPAAPYARLARNSGELDRILRIHRWHPDYRVAVVHAIEGGHALGGSLEPLEAFAAKGVAILTVTHFFNKGTASAANAYPFFADGDSGWARAGLSEFGRELIRAMEHLRIIVDVTHASSTAVEQILGCTTRPVIATHSSVKTLADHAYSLFDEHIQAIAGIGRNKEDGGFIGVPLYPYMLSNYATVGEAEEHGTLREVVRTIRHIVKMCGGDHRHVGIGSDFAGYIPHFKDLRCLGEIDKLRDLLLREFDRDEGVVEDIMANNAINFLLKNWGPMP